MYQDLTGCFFKVMDCFLQKKYKNSYQGWMSSKFNHFHGSSYSYKLQENIQMRTNCRRNIAYGYVLQTWIFGRTPWTDAYQNFMIRTPLLTAHNAM